MAECVCGAWLTVEHRMCPQCGRVVAFEANERSSARVSGPSIADRRLQELEDLKAACAERGIAPKFRYQPDEPAHHRWRCTLFLAGDNNGVPLSHGQGWSEKEALVRALTMAKNRILARRRREEGGLDDDSEVWSLRPKRADHFDNFAYSIWPIEGEDDA